MSRDHHITYKSKLACLICRKSWRKANSGHWEKTDLRFNWISEQSLICPQCGALMVNMGADFKAPAQSNMRQWRKVELLVRAGVLFQIRRFTQSEGDMAGPGPRPYSLREVEPFLASQAEEAGREKRREAKKEKAVRCTIA